MAHYAFLDEKNIVTEVIVGKDESNFDWEQQYGSFRGQACKRTSFNTHGGVHATGGTPFRKNYAGIGYTYDNERDAFVPPRSYSSWVLNEDTCLWESPVPMPTDGKIYKWNEDATSWIEVGQE
jgi:outer membrane protease